MSENCDCIVFTAESAQPHSERMIYTTYSLMSKVLIFRKREADISRIKGAMVLKGIFLEIAKSHKF